MYFLTHFVLFSEIIVFTKFAPILTLVHMRYKLYVQNWPLRHLSRLPGTVGAMMEKDDEQEIILLPS